MPVLTCFGCRRIGSEAPGGKGRPNYSLRRPMSALSAGNSNSRCSMTASSMLPTEKPNQPEEDGECGTECADLPIRARIPKTESASPLISCHEREGNGTKQDKRAGHRADLLAEDGASAG